MPLKIYNDVIIAYSYQKWKYKNKILPRERRAMHKPPKSGCAKMQCSLKSSIYKYETYLAKLPDSVI